MTRNQIAAKYVNVLDRVEDVRQDPRPPYTIITKVGQDIDLVRADAFSLITWPEWDESTLADLVGSGLLGE